jgi:hypothetical protein
MIEATDHYLAQRISLREVVGHLEASLDASEMKDEDLIREFYDYWGPLEVAFACNLETGMPIDEVGIRREVEAMRAFLLRTRNRVKACDPGRQWAVANGPEGCSILSEDGGLIRAR